MCQQIRQSEYIVEHQVDAVITHGVDHADKNKASELGV